MNLGSVISLCDRTRDPANPETYLSIIRSEVVNINRSSDAIVNARWADHARANAEIERLHGELATCRAVPLQDGSKP